MRATPTSRRRNSGVFRIEVLRSRMSSTNLRVAAIRNHRKFAEFASHCERIQRGNLVAEMGRDGHHDKRNSVIDPFNTVCLYGPGIDLGCHRACRHRARCRLSDCSGLVGAAEWPLVLPHRSCDAAKVLVLARRHWRIARRACETDAIRISGGAFTRKLQGFHGTARKRQPVRPGRQTALCRVPAMASPSRANKQGIVQTQGAVRSLSPDRAWRESLGGFTAT
jgi:hypothetical protein